MSENRRPAILAIDPGISLGWALGSERVLLYGVVSLDEGNRWEGAGMRYLRLQTWLRKVINLEDVRLVVFEEVSRHEGTKAAQVYGGIVATIIATLEEVEVPYQSVPIADWKRATGLKGNAKKEAVQAWARRFAEGRRQFRGGLQADDADAVGLLVWGLSHYSEALTV